MGYLDEFHALVGETVMECQRIEHDVKLLYAGMLKGDIEGNISLVGRKPLGVVIADLEALDNSDGHPYLSAKDYALLKEIKGVRNWLVHRCYMDYMYERGNAWTEGLDESYTRLVRFYQEMKTLGDQVEQVRIDILRKCGRS